MAWSVLADVDWSTGGEIDSGTIAEKRFLLVLTHVVIASGTSNLQYRLNGDSGTTYAERSSNNNAADSTHINLTSSDNQTYSGTGTLQSVCYIVNEADKDKLAVNCGQQCTVGSGTAPNRIWSWWKWGNSSDPITSVQAISNFTTDSNLTVMGTN